MSVGDSGDAGLRGSGIQPELGVEHVERDATDAVEQGGRAWKTGGAEIKLASDRILSFVSGPQIQGNETHTTDGQVREIYERFPASDIERMNLTEILDAREAINGTAGEAKEKFNTALGQAVLNAEAKIPAEELAKIDAAVMENLEEGYGHVYGFEGGIPEWIKSDDPRTAGAHAALTELISAKKSELMLEFCSLNNIGIGVDLSSADLQKATSDHTTSLFTLSNLELRQADCLEEFSRYGRDEDQERLLGTDALSFKEAFLNPEDISNAKAMIEYFDNCIGAYTELLSKGPEEMSKAELPGVPNFASLKLELYQKFYVNPETGEGWKEGKIPTVDTVNGWIDGVLKKAAEGTLAGKASSPVERRNAAVYSLFEKMGVLHNLSEHIERTTLVFDDGNVAVIGKNSSIDNDNGSSVRVNADGNVFYRPPPTEQQNSGGIFGGIMGLAGYGQVDVQKPEVQLMPGESVDLGNGLRLSLDEEGDRPIYRFTTPDIEKYEIETPPTLFERGAIGTSRAALYCVDAEGVEMTLEQYISGTKEMSQADLKEQLLGIQGYVHHSFDKPLESQTSWTEFDSVKELVLTDQGVRLDRASISDAQVDYAYKASEELMNAHAFALPDTDHSFTIQYSDDAEPTSVTTGKKLEDLLVGAMVHQAKISNDSATVVSGAADAIKGIFRSAKGMIFDRLNNQKAVEVLNLELAKVQANLNKVPMTLSEGQILELQAAEANLKSDIIWYKKDSIIAMMEKTIEATSVNSALVEHTRPDGWEDNLEALNTIFQSLGEELYKLDAEEVELRAISKEKNSQLSSSGGSVFSLSGAASLASSHVKTYLNRQTSLEELSQRKDLADIGYDMGKEFNRMKDNFSEAVKSHSADRAVTARGVTLALEDKAQQLARALHDNPELGALIVADIGQIKDILGNEGIAKTLTSRLQAHTLTKAFLEGVPEDGPKKPSDATIRELQAIADFLRVAVPLTGLVQGATHTNWVSSLTSKIPVVGGALSILTGAMYGAGKQELIRQTVTRMDDATRLQAYAVASTISEGSPKAYLEAHAKADAARAAGEISKAFSDEGNFVKNVIFRGVRAMKHIFTERVGSLVTLFKTSESPVDKAVAVIGLVAPVAGVAVGALAVAGVIATGPFIPLALILIGSLYVVSQYAKTKQPVINYLNDQRKVDAQDLATQFKKSDSQKSQEFQTKYKNKSHTAVHKGHQRGLYDKELRAHVEEFEAKDSSVKEAAIDKACTGKAFDKFSEARLEQAQRNFETITDADIRQKFHQKSLIKEKFDEIEAKMYESLLERATQEMSGVSFKGEDASLNPLDTRPRRPDGMEDDEFRDIVEKMGRQKDVPMDGFRFSFDTRVPPGGTAVAA